MNNTWQLAWRLLLWRQERRKPNWSAILSIVGVAVGTFVLVLSLSILNGFESGVRDSLITFENLATLQPKLTGLDTAAVSNQLRGLGFTVEPFAERKMLLQSPDGYRLVTARIVDDLESVLEKFDKSVTDRINHRPVAAPVVVGSQLARRLGLITSDEIRLVSPLDISLANPLPPQSAGEVMAIYELGVLNFDDAFIFIDFETATRLIPGLTERTSLAVSGPDDKFHQVAAQLNGDEWQIDYWEDNHRDLVSAMELEKLGSAIVLFLIIIVASFNSTSTMIMSVLEKYREIGILRTMGASRAFIKRLYYYQGLLIGVIGSAAGIGLGSMLALLQMAYGVIPGPGAITAGDSLPMLFKLGDIMYITAGAILLTLFSAWHPAKHAAAIEPGIAVNYQK
ncbi:FtsX-like permease family protein [Candidatus Neomarinimicrobiota bacterium]